MVLAPSAQAIEIGDLAADDWGAGLAGWNAKARGRSKSDGRRAKEHSASGDHRVGHMHFLPGWYSPMIVEPGVAAGLRHEGWDGLNVVPLHTPK